MNEAPYIPVANNPMTARIPEMPPVASVPGDDEFDRIVAEQSRGRASDVFDLPMAMNGIVNGDPVGMEMFDLGFYEDGTPAVVLNGAPVPVEHGQWMALLNMRKQSREEMDARFEFQRKVKDASSIVDTTMKSIPNLPKGFPEAMGYLARTNPDAAVAEMVKLGGSLADDGGKKQLIDVTNTLHNNRIDALTSALMSQGRETTQQVGVDVLDRPIFEKIREPSFVDGRRQFYSADRSDNGRVMQWAYSSVGGAIAPKDLRRATGGEGVGFIASIGLPSEFGGDNGAMGPYSRFAIVKALASDPAFSGMALIEPRLDPASQTSIQEYGRYLMALDQIASMRLGWDSSPPEAIMSVLSAMVANAQATPSQSMAAPAPAVPAQQQQQTPVDAAVQNAMNPSFE